MPGRLSVFGVCALSLLTACKNTTSLAGDNGTGGNGNGGTGAGAGGTGGTGGNTTVTTIATVTKVDILFSIDNSRSMGDKQQTLTLALPDLIRGLTNPPCLDGEGTYVSQPGALVDCPQGSARQYKPVLDIHIGVITSSLGGHGSDACSSDQAGKESNNDKARLIARLDPLKPGVVPTYQGKGFLAWDPAQTLVPPGVSDPALVEEQFQKLILGAGQVGCGYEAQLESMYRFLVDPEPPETVTLDADLNVSLQGIDNILLDQRKTFLRPDSMLVIVMLSDENDCSTREEGQFYLSNQVKSASNAAFHLPRARTICETDPNDMCCYSCGQKGPVDGGGNPICPADPLCVAQGGGVAFLDDLSDNINVRCFDQKRRFGIDFLYPTDRYVDALTQTTVPNRAGELVPNPLFSDLDPSDGQQTLRDPGLIVFAGIVGVPWQDIAKNPNDLNQGFKTTSELTQPNINGYTTWDIILGQPVADIPSLDPFMRESFFPRMGENPVIGEMTSVFPVQNSINGNEYTNSQRDELQYTCTMPIPEARDCTDLGLSSCDCIEEDNDNPVCAPDPNNDNKPTLQVRAKATPGLRQLAVLKGIGDQAVIGSICAGQITDSTLPDYAYRPAVSSLLDRVKGRLQ